MAFQTDFDGWISQAAHATVNVEHLALVALEDPHGVAQVLDGLSDDPDAALIRVLGVVEILNEILRIRKSLPDRFAEVLRKVRDAVAKIAKAFGAASYVLNVNNTPPSITLSVTFKPE